MTVLSHSRNGDVSNGDQIMGVVSKADMSNGHSTMGGVSKSDSNSHPLPSPAMCLTIDGLLKFHVADPVQSPLVAYPENGVSDFEQFTAQDLDNYADAAVAKYISLGLQPADPSLDAAPVVALLDQGSFEVIVTIFALNRLGWAVLFLSTRLATGAYVQLLSTANCHHIIHAKACDGAVEKVRDQRPLTSIPLITRKDYRGVSAPPFQRRGDPVLESRKIAWIIHSSGSTGYPKPIHMTNWACLSNVSQNFNLRSFCTSPLFHSHGLMSLFRCIYSKKPMFIYNWALPTTGAYLIEAIRAARPEMVCAVPYILKLLSEVDGGVDELAKTQLVLYAGSGCPQELGDLLVAGGVNLATNYGSTETGYIMNSFCRPGEDKWDWNYVRLDGPYANEILMDQIAPGLFECVALDGLPSKNISNSDDPPNSFRTRDLFSPHPDPAKRHMWQYVSRLDDRITLINGEKVLPVPMEGRIRLHPYIREAVMFGIGRTVPGVLVFRSPDAQHLTDGQYLDDIWPTVDAANAEAEKFATIPRDMVVVLPSHIAYPQTGKGTFIRAQVYDQFKTQIEAAFDEFENGTGTVQLDIPGLEAFLMDKFRHTLGVMVESLNTDLYAAGVDSLQATNMWSIIKKELDLGGHQAKLSRNVVFEKATVRQLARHLYAFRCSDGNLLENGASDIDRMASLIEKYSRFAPRRKDVLIITGTTGGLGAALLAEAVRRPGVHRVYALIRAADVAHAQQRVRQSLSSRDIQLSESERAKIVALPSTFSDPDLGLPSDTLQTLLSSLTHVFHAAWAVNFNLGLSSFEDQDICGLHNLINLCLRTTSPLPAQLFFCSSISVAGGIPRPAIVPEAVIDNLAWTQNMGYAKSKMVAEHIVRNAMKTTGMHARTLRIGQIVGDLTTGHWNDKEAIPLMIRSSLTTGTLPQLDETHSWLPIDSCARLILDVAFSDRDRGTASDPDLVYNVLNPQQLHWTRDILPALRRSHLPAFETVSADDWMSKLKASNVDPAQNPAISLVEFWEQKYHAQLTPMADGINPVTNGISKSEPFDASTAGETGTDRVVLTTKTLEASAVLSKVPNLMDQGCVDKFVDVWLKKWTPRRPDEASR